jgi:homoserine dehydrogenase
MAHQTYNLCLLGFGNVNRALLPLLCRKEAELRENFGISWRITGVATRRLGWIANPKGLDPEALTAQDLQTELAKHALPGKSDVRSWLRAADAHVLFEATSLNPRTGQPSIDHIRAALDCGAHAITANKGPVVHAYRELRDLAAERKLQFLFESTVMDGAPIFSLFRDNLPVVEVRGFYGILNSTTNSILTGMEEGLSFEESLKKAQAIGLAETDPSDDIDGWDAAVKVTALATVVMNADLRVDEVERQGIRGLSGEQVRAARAEGRPYKLVCRVARTKEHIVASVRPEQVPLTDPMAYTAGASSFVYFETDIFPGLAITENNPGLETTAYGMLADFVRAVRGRPAP